MTIVHVCGTYLHAAVVNDHRPKLNVGVEFRDFLTLTKEEPIRQFPDNTKTPSPTS